MTQPERSDFSLCPITIVENKCHFCTLRYGKGICAPNSSLLEGFELASLFTASGAAINIAEDTANFIEGRKSVSFDTNATAANAGIVKAGLSADFTSGLRRVAFFIPDATTLAVITSLQVILDESDNLTTVSGYQKSSGLVVGLNLFEFDPAVPTFTIGAPTRQVVRRYIFSVNKVAAGSLFTAPVSVDDFIRLGSLQEPCFNTGATCQDFSHYKTQVGFRTYRYTLEDAPVIRSLDGLTVIPCIRSDGIKLIPSKIDQERGLGARENLEVTFIDFLDDDIQTDLYRSVRRGAQGTYWRKFMVRNQFLKNREVFLHEGFGIRDMAGGVTVDLSTFRTRRYVTERVDGPNKRGQVQWVSKDILKLLDGVLIPPPTEAELRFPIDNLPSTTSIELKDGNIDAILEDAGSFPLTVIIDKEMILAQGFSGNFLTDCIRAVEGTEIDEHEADAKVQWVEIIEGLPDECLNTILTKAEVDPTLVDVAGNQDETNNWMTDFNLRRVIREPTGANVLVQELCEQTSSYIWWDTEQQIVKFRHIHPPGPGQVRPLLSDEESFIADSMDVKSLEEKRLSACLIFWGVTNWSDDLDKPRNFLRGAFHIDVEAEGPAQYDSAKTKKIFATWLPAELSAVARSIAARLVIRYRDPPRLADFRVVEKDAAILPSDLIDLKTNAIPNFLGAAEARAFFVTGKRRINAGGISYEFSAESFVFTQRFGFWSPDPHPDYNLATEEDREFAYWCDEEGFIFGDPPYRWV